MVGGKRDWTPGIERDPLDTVEGSVYGTSNNSGSTNWWRRFVTRENRIRYVIGGVVSVVFILGFVVLWHVSSKKSLSTEDKFMTPPVSSAQVSLPPSTNTDGGHNFTLSETDGPVIVLLTDSRETLDENFYETSNEIPNFSSIEDLNSGQIFDDISVEVSNALPSNEINDFTVIAIHNDITRKNQTSNLGSLLEMMTNKLNLQQQNEFGEKTQISDHQRSLSSRQPNRVTVTKMKIKSDSPINIKPDSITMGDMKTFVQVLLESLTKIPGMSRRIARMDIQDLQDLCHVMVENLINIREIPVRLLKMNSKEIETVSEIMSEFLKKMPELVSRHEIGHLENIATQMMKSLMNDEDINVRQTMLKKILPEQSNNNMEVVSRFITNTITSMINTEQKENDQNHNLENLTTKTIEELMDSPGVVSTILIMDEGEINHLGDLMLQMLVNTDEGTTKLLPVEEIEQVVENIISTMKDFSENNNNELLRDEPQEDLISSVERTVENLAPTLASIIAPELIPEPPSRIMNEIINISTDLENESQDIDLSELISLREMEELAEIFAADDPLTPLFEAQNERNGITENSVSTTNEGPVNNVQSSFTNEGESFFGIKTNDVTPLSEMTIVSKRPNGQTQFITMQRLSENQGLANEDSDKSVRVTSVQNMSNVTVLGPVATGYVNIYSQKLPSSGAKDKVIETAIPATEDNQRNKSVPGSQVTINIFGSHSQKKKVDKSSEITSRRPSYSIKANIPKGSLNIDVTKKDQKISPINGESSILSEFDDGISTSYSKHKLGSHIFSTNNKYPSSHKSKSDSGQYTKSSSLVYKPVRTYYEPHAVVKSVKHPNYAESFVHINHPFNDKYHSNNPVGNGRPQNNPHTISFNHHSTEESLDPYNLAFDQWAESSSLDQLPAASSSYSRSPLPVPQSMRRFLFSSEPLWIRDMGPI